METETYKFTSDGDYWDLRHTDEKAFLKGLSGDITRREGELESFLSRYCDKMREEYSGGAFECLCEDIAADDTGEASLSFYGYVHLPCKDMSGTEDHWETVAFALDVPNKAVTLKFTYLPEREPEEF